MPGFNVVPPFFLGVTTEIFGEGTSAGPLNSEMKQRALAQQGDYKFDIPWNKLAEYLTYLEKRGVSPNIASFMGAGTIRTYVIGLDDKQATPEQLRQMREVVRREMEAGALGIGCKFGLSFFTTVGSGK